MEEAKARYGKYLYRRYGDRSTPYHYLCDLALFIQEVGPKDPRSVRVGDIDQFVDGQVKRGLKPSSINRRVASLHTFFEFLASEVPDEVWPNPVNHRRHGIKQGTSLPRDASDSAVEALFAVIDDARDRAIFGLMVGAGLRVGEVVTLRLSYLEQAPAPGQAARLRVMGKGRKERFVWLTPRWVEIVEQWRQERPQVGHDFLFLNQHDRQLTVAGVQYRLREHIKVAGVFITCHQLRHTFARRLAEQRMPIESISKLLGHSQLGTTLLYTAGADPDLRDAFLGSMAQIEAMPVVPPVGPSPALSSKRQEVKADIQALEAATARLTALPLWLRTPVAAYLHQRWRNWQPHLAASHADRLGRQLVQIWRWFLDETPFTGWETLQRSHVEAWLDALAERGLKVNTRRSQLSTLFGCLHHACDQELPIAANVFRIPYPKRSEILPKYLEPQECKSVIETVFADTEGASPRAPLDRAWFLTLLNTGIRTCELLDLRLSDVDFAGKRILIHTSKNNHARVVFMTPDLSSVLTAYLAHRPQTDDDHFWIDKGQPLGSTRVRYCFERWAKLSQVPVSAHRLRHTLATYLINHDMPIHSIAKLLGHHSLNTTQQYARILEPALKRQFLTAMSHIEGILSLDWPAAYLLNNAFHEQSFDSL